MFANDCQLLIDGTHGQYIPQLFIQQYADTIVKDTIRQEDIDILQSGPDNDLYWDTWDTVLDSAVLQDAYGTRWILYQSGDLWIIREGVELPEYF